MVKYSLETKLKAVNNVLELHMSVRAVAKSLHASKSVIQRWVERYEEHGINGLTMKAGTYSGDFKVRVVEYLYENDMSLCRAAAHFGIPGNNTVGDWERIYRAAGPGALYKDNRGRKYKVAKYKIKKPEPDKPGEEDLLAEVKRLRMENEYLKKLNALVQAREKSAKKTK